VCEIGLSYLKRTPEYVDVSQYHAIHGRVGHLDINDKVTHDFHETSVRTDIPPYQ
jgi:hypothetical protein